MIEGYEQAFDKGAEEADETDWRSRAGSMKKALMRKWKHLARERIEDEAPTIPLGKRFWPLTKTERGEILELFESEKVRRLVTSMRSRDDDAPIKVLTPHTAQRLQLARPAALCGADWRGWQKAGRVLPDGYQGSRSPRSAFLCEIENAARQRGTPCCKEHGTFPLRWGHRMLADKVGSHSVFMQ